MISNNKLTALAFALLGLVAYQLAYQAQAAKPNPGLDTRGIFSMIKSVPEAATLEYRVGGQVVQSIDIKPGTYKISITQLH